ncbi:MAG TPA: SCP2 sterol-binding domain-containing protein [Polyangia bacterium]|nr:SCP2 sterol-binding domain-containing protein [Polyangia bacterium]
MENQGQESEVQRRRWEADSPALAGVSGRLRLMVDNESLGVLTVDDGHLSVTDDAGAVDVTIMCTTREDLVKMLRGEVNVVVAALRGQVRMRGNRELGAKVVLGLRAGSPFVRTPFDAKDG